MRIAVLDLTTGRVDILKLSEDAKRYFNMLDDSREFFEFLGYDYESIDWMTVEGNIQEHEVDMNNSGYPFIDW